MKVEFQVVDSADKEKAVIHAMAKTEDIQNAIDLLEGGSGSIAVKKDGENHFCRISNIYYLESIDKKSFVYTKDNCYETKYRLYELEGMLNMYFVRCSKAMIINIRKIKAVKSEMSGSIYIFY